MLSKCDLLLTVAELYGIMCPPSVVKEVASASLQKKYPDALTIAKALDNGAIKVRSPSLKEFKFPLSLHRGEKDALRLALETKDSILATDDGRAIKAARFLKVPFIITPRIVTELFRLGKISFSVAKASIEKLGVIGRYSPEILAEALLSLKGET